MTRPDDYPLPWCEAFKAPYWQVNLIFCNRLRGWHEWQSRKDMQEIIPRIDAVIAAASQLETAA